MTKPKVKHAILIVSEGRTVDWVSTPEVIVAYIDWDDMRADNCNEHMPEDVKEKIAEVKKLPDAVPWKAATLQRLQEYLEKVIIR